VKADGWMTVREAWTEALYGPSGFYRVEQPGDHFTTSSHVSPAFAEATASMARRHGASTVLDLGAGGGELLAALYALEPDLALVGVDLRARPEAFPEAAVWRQADDVVAAVAAHASDRTLVIANELLDNVPCDVVSLDATATPRLVEVRPDSGERRLGAVAPADAVDWLQRWWPLAEPGQCAAVGLSRDRLWADVCSAVPTAVCVAVDFGHVADSRPPDDGVVSYRRGVMGPPRLDGQHDVTADVAVDSVAAAAGATLVSQADALADLGLSARRPPVDRAHADPSGYLRALAAASSAGALMARPGLGDFWWIVSGRPAAPGVPDGSMDASREVRA
jgi:SAM-dependent MidA family methyltransferase